jgi:hypothetical protein
LYDCNSLEFTIDDHQSHRAPSSKINTPICSQTIPPSLVFSKTGCSAAILFRPKCNTKSPMRWLLTGIGLQLMPHWQSRRCCHETYCAYWRNGRTGKTTSGKNETVMRTPIIRQVKHPCQPTDFVTSFSLASPSIRTSATRSSW